MLTSAPVSKIFSRLIIIGLGVFVPLVSFGAGKTVLPLRTALVQYQRQQKAAMNLSKSDAAKLMAQWRKNPDDEDAAVKLLAYAGMKNYLDPEVQKWKAAIIEYLVANRPDGAIIGCPFTRALCQVHRGNPGAEKILKLWEQQVAKHPENLKILWNAQNAVFHFDRDKAEKFLIAGAGAEPSNPRWPRKLGLLYQLSKRYREALRQYEKAYELTPDRKKQYYVYDLARLNYVQGNYAKAEKYLKLMFGLLKHADKKAWNYGNLIYEANTLSGLIALTRDNNPDKACEYMLKAARTPGSPQLRSFGPNMELANQLLARGRKAEVIEYLELCGGFWKKKACREAIRKIRAGENVTLNNFLMLKQ